MALNRDVDVIYVTISHDDIPQELKAERRWVGWSWAWDDEVSDHGRWRQPNELNGELVDHLDPLNWRSFDDMAPSLKADVYDGMCFVTGADEDGNYFSQTDLADRLHPRMLPQDFDAEAAVQTSWHRLSLSEDLTGDNRLLAIAQQAVKAGLEDDDIATILRKYAEDHELACDCSYGHLCLLILYADPSWEDDDTPLSKRTEFYGTLYSDHMPLAS